MAHVDDDATRVQAALDALDGVAAVNLTEDSFESFNDAVQKLEDLEDSLTAYPDCSVDPRDGGDA